jgi:F-type H+-transporting ATPase subunit gamma
MPNLKDIRTRIKSVKNTQKITQAMRMVAAAKVRKAENGLKQSRPYTYLLEKMMASVLPELVGELEQFQESLFYNALNPRMIKRVGIFVVAGDRGLCGVYNNNILQYLTLTLKDYARKRVQPRLFVLNLKYLKQLMA